MSNINYMSKLIFAIKIIPTLPWFLRVSIKICDSRKVFELDYMRRHTGNARAETDSESVCARSDTR